MKRIVWILVMLVFLTSVTPRARADYNITLTKDAASVALSATLIQNVSTIQPTFSSHYLPSNSSAVQNSFNDAAKSLTPSATVRDLSMNVSSNGSSIQIGLAYRVGGVSFPETGPFNAGLLDLDLAWRALAVRSDFVIDGDSVNLVGNAYYLLPIQQLTTHTVGGTGTATTFLNGENRPANVVQNATKYFALLDFSFLNVPLDTWRQSFDLTSQTTTWRTTAGFNITVLTQFNEQGGGVRFEKAVLWYVTNAEVVAPGLAAPIPNGVKIDTGSPVLLVMIALILGSIGVLAVSFFTERKINATSRFRKPKRRSSR